MSVIKHKDQRVAVLIDVQNMYHSARNLYNARVNFNEIVRQAVGGRRLVRALAYVVRTKTGEEKPFIEALSKLGIEIREKDLQEFFGGAKKADWDVGITIDAVRLSEIVDAVVLASGDGDFIPVLEYLKGRGRQAEVIAFGRTASSRLRESADDFIDLGENKEKFLIKTSRKKIIK
ncbi:MAG: NYN domain-containing protein [Parcubacteria group bacterium]|nr:NYN domain-containing protein [Parcubacteria group bacterium]